MNSASEPSSRRQNLEDELRRVQETVASLDTHIDGLKREVGWTTTGAGGRDDTQVQTWKTLLTRSPLAEAYREFSATRSRPGQKTRSGARGRGRVIETTTPGSRMAGSKRTRVLSSRDKRIEAIWTQCNSILSALKKHRHSWPFLEPVDAEGLNIPDYYEVIRRPMDLGSIERRLAHDPRKGRYRQYTSALEFRDDVRQVWTNCRTYNKPGQDVRIMCDVLSELWEKKWCQAEIESKWENRNEPQLGDEVCQETGWMAGTRKKAMRGTMSFMEKRKLARQIGSLNSEQVAIISELLQTLNFSEEEGEIVLNFEKLDSQTLWTIKNKVDSLSSKIRRTAIQP